jgi:DNA (cytosine-5)-methyltransferase 1
MNYTNENSVIIQKLERLNQGKQPRVLDLFSGCGGISLGFDLAGYEIMAGIDVDPHASKSHAINFHSHLPTELFEVHAKPKDITSISPHELLGMYGFNNSESEVDVLVGGPPCPAFARVGRAKLREVREHPEAFRQDPRAKLYIPYLEYVNQLKPLALLMENVPDILNYGGHNLAEEICEILEQWDYKCSYSLLNSANYGVPQMRERFFLIGIHNSIKQNFDFPIPTRAVEFPQGYKGSRQVALKHVQQNALFENYHYVPTPAPLQKSGKPVTVRQAIEDLPSIIGHLEGTITRGARRFDMSVTYRDDVTPSAYAWFMRTWPGFESDGRIWDHVIRSLSIRDYRLFKNMKEGDDYPKAYALAEKMFLEAISNNGSQNKPDYKFLRPKYVPPYDPGKFPNKWRKMEADEPARTLMAHLGKDSYSHIHFDSEQARVISVREAARLQSFPDGFKFSGTMNPAFRQIGNAVPPLMAFALARQLLKTLYDEVDSKSIKTLQETVSKYRFLKENFNEDGYLYHQSCVGRNK